MHHPPLPARVGLRVVRVWGADPVAAEKAWGEKWAKDWAEAADKVAAWARGAAEVVVWVASPTALPPGLRTPRADPSQGGTQHQDAEPGRKVFTCAQRIVVTDFGFG